MRYTLPGQMELPGTQERIGDLATLVLGGSRREDLEGVGLLSSGDFQDGNNEPHQMAIWG